MQTGSYVHSDSEKIKEKILRKFWSCRSIAGDSRQPLKECFVNEEKMEVGKNYSKVF